MKKSKRSSVFWKFLPRIEILVKNRNFAQKSKFCSKIEILIKSPSFGQTSKFRLKSDPRNRFDPRYRIGLPDNFQNWDGIIFSTDIY